MEVDGGVEFSPGGRVAVTWAETGTRFAATVIDVSPNKQTVNVKYDERVRGKDVYENNVELGRVEPWVDELHDGEAKSGVESAGGSSSSSSSRRVSTSSDSMGLIHRLAQMREDGDLDAQTVNLSSAQIVQLHDSMTIPTSKFPKRSDTHTR